MHVMKHFGHCETISPIMLRILSGSFYESRSEPPPLLDSISFTHS